MRWEDGLPVSLEVMAREKMCGCAVFDILKWHAAT